MVLSKYCTKFIPANVNNYYGARNGIKIDRIIIHHMAAVWTAQRCGESFQNPSRGGSSNYGIGNDGEINGYVAEDYISGASNNYTADSHAITIEVSNSVYGNAGGWPVSDAALKSLINLCADIAKRYNFGKLVKGKNLCWHKMYAATACPGPYLLSKMDYIVDEVNKILAPVKTDEGYYSGFNIARTADALCIYIDPLKQAPTNKYGWEVAVDNNAIAICDAVYGKGKMDIPSGGRVISGHGKGGQFVSKIKKGYKVWIQDGRVYFNTKQHHSIDGIDKSRGTNELIVYHNNKIKRNIWGCEVAVNKNGIVTNTPVYGKCNISIPSGGYVLSAHGDAAWWMLKYLKKNTALINDNNKVITVK